MNNDLISREALKKKLRLVQEAIENDENILKDVFNLIDNAPTVNKCDNCDLMFLAKTRGE